MVAKKIYKKDRFWMIKHLFVKNKLLFNIIVYLCIVICLLNNTITQLYDFYYIYSLSYP